MDDTIRDPSSVSDGRPTSFRYRIIWDREAGAVARLDVEPQTAEQEMAFVASALAEKVKHALDWKKSLPPEPPTPHLYDGLNLHDLRAAIAREKAN
jgi:hypothetical protein